MKSKLYLAIFDELMAKVYDVLHHEIMHCQLQLSNWKEKFETNPAYALDWSHDAFQNAAKLEILLGYRDWAVRKEQNPSGQCMTGQEWLTAAVEEIEKDIDRRTYRANRSTSITSNLIEEERRIALCRVRDTLAYLAGMPRRF